MSKTIFITGASTGFGRIAADILHQKGHTVFGTSRNPGKHDTAFELTEMDVTNGESIKKAVAAVRQKFVHLDVLINNAGRVMFGPIEEASDNNIRELFETNVFGLMQVTAEVLPIMREQRSGRIINVTSLAGITATPSIGIYSATKHAVEGYSKSLMLEVEQFGIDVLLVKPGEYMTDAFANSLASDLTIDDYGKYRNLIDQQVSVKTPDNLLPPAEVGQLIADLVDQENPKVDNLIGAFSDVIPGLLATPEQIYAVCREVYQLDSLIQ